MARRKDAKLTPEMEAVKFKPGQSGNPNGRPKMDPAIKRFKECSYKQFIDKLQEFGVMNEMETKETLSHPSITNFDAMFGNLVVKAREGDKDARKDIFERLWGKVKEVHDVTNHNHKSDLDEIPKERIIEFLREKE